MSQDNNIALALKAHLRRYSWDKSLNQSDANASCGVYTHVEFLDQDPIIGGAVNDNNSEG